jgi:hypothetical protein
MALRAPILSLWDPAESTEGGVDPLSLATTNERLAERIFPFMTVRMRRPRFLTAIAVAARICEGFEDEVAADGVTPAWLVCEWLVIEAFVRRRERIPEGERWALPGTQKVERAFRGGRRLGAAAYLKTPKVFGFTGVYKTLAVGLEIVAEDDLALDDGGYQLLRTWERERRLPGFLDGGQGAGARFREEMRRAVRDAMAKGFTDRRAGWPMWDEIVSHLEPSGAGGLEREWLHGRLLDPACRANPRDSEATQMRRELFRRVQALGRPVLSRAEEASFFRSICAQASGSGAGPELRERLDMIDAYEALCRCIEDALALILFLSTERGGAGVTDQDFAADPLAPRLAAAVRPALHRIREAFDGSGWEREVMALLERYGEVEDPQSLFATVLEHHHDAQRAKPPDGKRSWVEDLGSRGVAVRTRYQRIERPAGDDDYVRDYRSSTASQFLQDLGKLPK